MRFTLPRIDLLTVENRLAEEFRRLVDECHRLGEVDDVDAVALVEDVGFHLRVPALRLVAEVKPSVEEILKRQARGLGGRHIHLVS